MKKFLKMIGKSIMAVIAAIVIVAPAILLSYIYVIHLNAIKFAKSVI